MKLYQYEPPDLIRVNIKKQGVTTEHLSFSEITQQEMYDFVKQLILQQNLSIFATGHAVNVEFRESIKGINGKAVSFSFKGMQPSQVKELILQNIK